MGEHRALRVCLAFLAVCAWAVAASADTPRTWQQVQRVTPPAELMAKAWKPFTVPEEQARRALHVNGPSPAASDENPGTEGMPLKTVARAAALAMESKKGGEGVRVLIHPGVYREYVLLDVPTKQEEEPGAHDTDAPILFEATEKGKAILSGADVWTGWVPEPGGKVYRHAWPHKWGFTGNPWAEHGVDFPMRERRREQVMVHGRPLLPVLRREELAPGLFHVSEEEGLIRICLPAGKSIRKAVVEVGTRDGVFHGRGVRNLVIRGLTFRYSSSVLYQHSVGFYKVRGLVMEECASQWHNRMGVVVHMCDDVILRRLDLNRNGNGNSINFCRNLLLEDVDTSYNNWRGAWNGWHGWEISGIKAMYNHGVLFRRHRALDNQTGGLWLDTDTENMVMVDCVWSGNDGGLSLENNQGPVAIINCVMARNRSAGLTLDKSQNGLVAGCTIVGNRGAQINVQGPPVANFTNWDTKQALSTQVQDWTFERNLVASYATDTVWAQTADYNYLTPRAAEPLLCMPAWDAFLTTLQSRGNLWYHPMAGGPFQVGSVGTSEELVGLSFRDWQGVTGQDRDSLFADPRLAGPGKDDLRLLAASPALQWERRPVTVQAALDRAVAEMGFGVTKLRQRLRGLRGPADPGPFPGARGVPEGAWAPLDLSGLLNRPLAGVDGWIGVPLTQLAPGRQVLAGVPFVVADPAQYGEMGAVALRSAKVISTRGKEVPAAVEVPVGRRAAAVYVLHGCGWVKAHGPIGRYELVYEDGTSAALPVVAYGPEDAPTGAGQRAASNIQDWWPTVEHFSDEHTRFVRVPESGVPAGEKRYLYAVEWPNPQPAKPIRAIRLSGDPANPGSLMVLAITLR